MFDEPYKSVTLWAILPALGYSCYAVQQQLFYFEMKKEYNNNNNSKNQESFLSFETIVTHLFWNKDKIFELSPEMALL